MAKITLKRENVIKQVESEEQALLLELKGFSGWMQPENPFKGSRYIRTGISGTGSLKTGTGENQGKTERSIRICRAGG